MFRPSQFSFLVIFGDKVTKIRKYYVIFVYILQGKMGKMEKNGKKITQLRWPKYQKAKDENMGWTKHKFHYKLWVTKKKTYVNKLKYPIFWRFSCQCPWIYYLRPSSAKTAKKAEGWFQLTAADFFHSRSLPNRYYCDEMIPSIDLGAEYLVFVSSRSLKMREKCTNWDNLVCLSLHIFWGQSHLCLLLQNTF